ncbi:MAG TPA: GNAT family protein [Gemmatimonadales bacterium]|nr:GNAT family protein [Gemmatimonadales bacterium]
MNPLATPSLELIPMTGALAAAEHSGRAALAAALRVPVPAEWPPQFYEADDLDRMTRLLHDERNAGWTLYYLVRRAPARTLVGVAGFGGRPTTKGVVEIGYGLLAEHRRMGLATEAVMALLEFAFHHPSVEMVVAETFPHLQASIGVLQRTGFRLDSESGRGGALRFQRFRSMDPS